MSVVCSLSPVPDYVKATVETVLKIHETEDDGDVLAFLTGQVSQVIFLNDGYTSNSKARQMYFCRTLRPAP